jgi:hypothetical protein
MQLARIRAGVIAAATTLGCGGAEVSSIDSPSEARSARRADPIIVPATPTTVEVTDQPEAEPELVSSEQEPAPSDHPLAARRLGAPVPSLAEFRKAHPVERDPSCGPIAALPRRAPVRAAGRGPVRAVEIVRLAADMACAPIEQCSLAIRTAKGWFVAEPEETCAGVVGPATRVARRDEQLSWAGSVIEYRYTTVTTRSNYSSPTEHRRATRWLVLCGVGASGEPSCTEAVAVSCTDQDGVVSDVSWTHEDGKLVLASKRDPDECLDGPVVVGSHPLEFP